MHKFVNGLLLLIFALFVTISACSGDGCGTVTCMSPGTGSYTIAEVVVSGSPSSCQQLITNSTSVWASYTWTQVSQAPTCEYDTTFTITSPITGNHSTSTLKMYMGMSQVDVPGYGTKTCSQAQPGAPVVVNGCSYNVYVCQN
jgi:hypothetical protein